MTGGLLKFALDKEATEELRQAFSLVGFLLSLLGLFACFLGLRLNRILKKDVETLEAKLGIESLQSNTVSIKYITYVAMVFVIVAAAGWSYVILSH